VAERQMLSKTYPQGAKGAKLTAAVVCLLVGLALTAKAQEPTYSADSLTATFEKGSHLSLKRTEIFVRDVVAETKLSKVIFKNSQGGRVICELGSSAAQLDKQPVVGTELRVQGKVRGRGFLGNMTLDDCKIAPIEESTATPYTAPPEAVSAEPDEIPKTEETPLPASVPDRPQSVAKQSATPPGARRATFADQAEYGPNVPPAIDHPENPIRSAPSESRAPWGFYSLLVLSGAVASSILSKLLAPIIRGSRPSVRENTPEERKAALQALLLKNERKKQSGD
jgi:hypothetical protein